jgi:hypothetical protein
MKLGSKLMVTDSLSLVFSMKELYQHLRDAPDVVHILQNTEHLLQRNALSDVSYY